ncbi:MAG: hypothetical protein KGQ52_09190 [Alphaproteobacteria bacterium]|nr:hypothetical protein [Alphaproteobacteria bacterium]
MDDLFSTPTPRRWPWLLAIIASLIWVAAIAGGWALATGHIVLIDGAQPLAIAGLALIAPLAVVWLAAINLRDAGAIAALRAEAAQTRAQLAGIEVERSAAALAALQHQLDTTANRIAALARPVAAHTSAIADAARGLEASNEALARTLAAAVRASTEVASAVPAATQQASGLIDLLARADNRLRAQLAETETLLAALYTRASEAEAQARTAAATSSREIGALGAAGAASLAQISAAAAEARTAVEAPLAALHAALDAANTRTLAVVDGTRDAVHTQTSAMLAGLDQARTTLAHIGGDAARLLDERLAALHAMAGRVTAEIAGAGASAETLVASLGAQVEAMEARLASAMQASTAALAALDAGVASATTSAGSLGQPIDAAAAGLARVQGQLQAISQDAGSTIGLIETSLPASEPLLAALASRLAALKAEAEAIAAPIQASSNSVDGASDRLGLARDALAASSAELADAIARAQDQLREMEAGTSRLALTTSTDLIDSFGRVREVAQAAAGAMKTALAGVVAEAEAALDEAAASRAEAAFAAPIRASITELVDLQGKAGDSAQAAAERVAQRVLALTTTLAEVESHVAAVETRADVRARNALGRRASGLIDSLQGSAVDLARLLDFDLDDKAWADYAAGNRGAIARRLEQGLDHGTGRQFVRHFAHDQEFRAEAGRFMSEFEALVSDIVPDRGGEALGAVLLSSTLGKLYLALSQAAGRFN